MSVLELVLSVAHAEEESSALFQIVLEALSILNDSDANSSGVVLHFELKLLENLGFRPDLSLCSNCRKPLELHFDGTKSQVFRSSPGGIDCPRCLTIQRGNAEISREAVSFLQSLQGTTVNRVMEMKLTPSLCEEGRNILWYYFRCHIERIKPLRSEVIFSAVI
jgi:DNA repair protein RecO